MTLFESSGVKWEEVEEERKKKKERNLYHKLLHQVKLIDVIIIIMIKN